MMKKSQMEKTLEEIGIKPRDEFGNLRSEDELTEEVMAVFDRCDGVNKMFLLSMIELSKQIDDGMNYLKQY